LTEPTREATIRAEHEPRAGSFDSLLKCLEKLRQGSSYCYRAVNLWIAPDGYLEVRVHPDWRDDDPEDRSTVDDAAYARSVLADAAVLYPEVGSLIYTHPWRFVRIHDDETGFTSHYYLRDGLMSWSLELL
jgi:hypothetical protein